MINKKHINKNKKKHSNKYLVLMLLMIMIVFTGCSVFANFNHKDIEKTIQVEKNLNDSKINIDKTEDIDDEIDSNQKVVYLTFDDGPSQNTKKIIDILDRYDAKATFFVTGCNPNYNKYIKEAHDKGHSIGLHTYTHQYDYVYSSVDNYFEDLKSISDMVVDLTGESSNIIRFPGGSSNTISANVPGLMSELTELVQDKGYQYFDWNADSTDASGNGIPVSQLIKNSTSYDYQYINILFHDSSTKDTTVEALPAIIEYYKDKGYIFLGLENNSFPAHHSVNN